MNARHHHHSYRFSGSALLVLLLLAGSALSARGQEQKTITWGQVNNPPAYILEGPETGIGLCDQAQAVMMEQLTDYTHTVQLFPHWSRMLQQIIDGEHVCSSCLAYRPPGHIGLQGVSFSMPNALYFLQHLIVRREDRHLYGEEVSIEDVLQDRDRRLGILTGMSYNPAVSAVLSRYAGVEDIWLLDAVQQIKLLRSIPNLYVHIDSDGVESLVEMLRAQHVEALLLEPAMTLFAARKLGIADQISLIPVAETRGEIGVLAYACPNTDWGRQVIAEINRILEVQRTTPAYKDRVGSNPYLLRQDEAYWSLWDEKVLAVHE